MPPRSQDGQSYRPPPPTFTHAYRKDTIHRQTEGNALFVVEALRARGQAVDPAQLAWHFASAGMEHARKAATYAREAAERALEAAAYDTALRHLESAASFPDLSPAERADLARLRAWALHGLTRFGDVAPCLVEAFDLYVSSGDIARAVDVAAFDACPQGAEHLQREPMRSLRERALELVAPESPEAARLLCVLAETLSYAHRDQAAECLSRAMDLARSFADRRLEARVLYARAWLEYRNLDTSACLASGAAALDAARAAGDRDLELLFGGCLAMWKLLCGDPSGAEDLILALRGGGELRPSLWTDELQHAERMLLTWTGRWDELRRRLEEQKWIRGVGTIRGVARKPGQPLMRHTRRQMLADIERRPHLYINPDRLTMHANTIADSCVDQGDRSALPAVRQVIERALAMELSPLGRLHAQSALAFISFLQPDRALLERACGPELCGAPADLIIERPGCAVGQIRGLLFGLMGRADEARTCFERAMAFARRCGLIFNIYETAVKYAVFLVREGDLGRAREVADEAHRAGARLSQKGHARLLADVMSRLEGGLPDGLTAREVEVLALAARGLATKQIAAELNISKDTATNHLSHIYAKTGARSRVDAAAYALRHQLGGPAG